MNLTINKKRMFAILALGTVLIVVVILFITKLWPDIEFEAIRDEYLVKAKEMTIGVTIDDEQVYGDDINSLTSSVALTAVADPVFEPGHSGIEQLNMTDMVYFPDAGILTFGTLVSNEQVASLKPLAVTVKVQDSGVQLSSGYVNNTVIHKEQGLLLSHVKITAPLEENTVYEISLAGTDTAGNQLNLTASYTYLKTDAAALSDGDSAAA